MSVRNLLKGSAAALVIGMTYSASIYAADKAVLVLDGSGSMWEQIDGTTKIQVAREVIVDLIQDWNDSVELGMTAYGHREKGSCSDIETLLPIGPVDPKAMAAIVDGINPKGKTPLTAAVREAASSLRYEEERATVILVSDGEETCGGDPCAVAKELKSAGIDFTIHVVGFDLTDEETENLRCVADNTGGQFLQAANAQELHQAMVVVKEEVVEKASTPEPRVILANASGGYVDTFDGTRPREDWVIDNEDQNSYVVEDGALLMVSASNDGRNHFRLTSFTPEGDWDMSTDIYPDFVTGGSGFALYLRDDANKGLGAYLTYRWEGFQCPAVALKINYNGSPQKETGTVFWKNGDTCHTVAGKDNPNLGKDIRALSEQGATLTLHKRGRKYYASLASPVLSNGTVRTGDLSVLRLSGSPSFRLYKDGGQGDNSVLVDEFRITPVN